MTAAAVTETLRLDDGRAVAYTVHGDPDGVPILNCHGGLMCRFEAAPADAAAKELGLQVVTPDRPGVGRSDRHPSVATVDWCADAEALAEHLGWGRFGVVGWSLGGQYALAVGARLASRVTAVGVIAGCVPLDGSAERAGLSAMDRRLASLSRHAPLLARGAFAVMRTAALRAPARAARNAVRGASQAEADAVMAEAQWFGATLAEGLRDTRGAVDEYRTMVAPWGFRPEEVEVPVRLWQGSADTLVPAEWAAALAQRLPQASLTLLEGEGHMIGLTRRADVLATFAADL